MQTRNPYLDDFSRLFVSMASGAGSVKDEFEKEMRARLEDFLNKDLVSRDEFEMFRELLQNISTKQDDILMRLEALEKAQHAMPAQKPNSKPAAKRKTTTSKASASKTS